MSAVYRVLYVPRYSVIGMTLRVREGPYSSYYMAPSDMSTYLGCASVVLRAVDCGGGGGPCVKYRLLSCCVGICSGKVGLDFEGFT